MPQLLALARRLKQIPLINESFRRHYHERFLSEAGYARHDGMFQSFEGARMAVPRSAEFDQTVLAADYTDRLDEVFPYDYPVILWLQRALSEGCRSVLDIGGSIGVHYFAYQKYIQFPRDLRWVVSEVPAMVTAGRQEAESRGAAQVEFTTELRPETVEESDILISAGTLHYIETPALSDLLSRCKARPTHILLNKLPLYDGEDFVSLQNIHQGFAPHYVFNRARFIAGIVAQGYALCDRWSVLERSFWIYGHPEQSFGAYSGLYFRKLG